MGLPIATTVTMSVEITPYDKRGKVLVVESSSFALGVILSCLVAWRIFDAPNQGDWRLLMFYMNLPILGTTVLAYFYLKESPRFAL